MTQLLLSPYSQTFYNEWKLNQNRTDYNIVFDQELEGVVHVSRLRVAVNRLISDYVILNSYVVERNEELYWTKNNEPCSFDFFKKTLVEKDILSYVSKPFNLIRGPLYRFGLIRKNSNHYRLIIVFHHIIIDGLSYDNFCDELSNYYNDQDYKGSLSEKEQFSLITNLSQSLTDRLELNRSKSLSFWKARLSDDIEPLSLNFLKVTINKDSNFTKVQQELMPSPNQLGEVNTIRFSFDNIILQQLSQLAKKYQITAYLYGQAIYAFLLYKYTGQNKFCIQYPVAINEGKGLIYGAHVNSNIIIYDFSKITSILDIVNQARTFIKSLKDEGIDHRHLPIPEVVSVSNNSLPNIPFTQTNLRDKAFNFNGIKTKINSNTNINLIADLSFEQEPLTTEINYRVKYKKEKISKALLDTFISNYKQLFTEVLYDLNELNHIKLNNIKNYFLLSQTQHDQIIHTWNQTDKAYSDRKTIHQLFEEQVEKSPDSIAVVYEDTKITYKELNIKANQLANYIIQNYNVTQDTLIGLCLDRSEHMIIAILAVLKAGGAYIPIDSNYPDERIKYILEDTKAKIVLTNNIYKQKLEFIIATILTDAISTKVAIAIDNQEVQKELSLCSIINPEFDISFSNSNLAYIIYTSGTTGNPKGVMIEHKSLINYLQSIKDKFTFDKIDKHLMIAEYNFDLGYTSVFGAIIIGAELHITTKDFIFSMEQTIKYIKYQQISVIKTTPLYFKLLITSPTISSLDELNNSIKVILGGEKLSFDILSWLTQKKEKIQFILYNHYGPTETTIGCITNLVDFNQAMANPAIGAPIYNTKSYVLDANLSPVPIGAMGELYIGGVGLARGYLNRPDLTAEKFIANPFQTAEEQLSGKNARLYKTGDLVRWLPDGNIEYIGRNDFQVKIRGYRVELGEIESTLKDHGDVLQAVVTVKDKGQFNDKSLVAYIVSGEFIPSEIELKEFLTNKLSEYMIPNVFVYLEKLPLTANGKLNRKALPDPEFGGDKDNYVAPRNEIENQVCKIWSEILGLPENEIGIRDDFFRLGGNSILAIRLVSKLNNYYQSHLKVSDIFVHRNIESLLAKINQTKGTYQTIVKLNNTYDKPNMFIIHPGLGGCETYTSLANALTNNFSCYGVDSYNLYNENKIDNLHELAKYYLSYINEIMIKTHQEVYHLLGWSLGGKISLEIASILEQEGNTKIKVYLLDTTLIDDYLLSLGNEIDIEKLQNKHRDYAISIGYDKFYIEKFMLNMIVSNNLGKQKISSILANTHILLFKAMLQPNHLTMSESKKVYEYLSTLKYNNIDKVVNDKSKIKLIKINDAYHENILEQERVLVLAIQDF